MRTYEDKTVDETLQFFNTFYDKTRDDDVLFAVMQPEALQRVGRMVGVELTDEQPCAGAILLGVPVLAAHDPYYAWNELRVITAKYEDLHFARLCEHMREYFDKHKRWPSKITVPEAVLVTIPKSWFDGFGAPIRSIKQSRLNTILMGE